MRYLLSVILVSVFLFGCKDKGSNGSDSPVTPPPPPSCPVKGTEVGPQYCGDPAGDEETRGELGTLYTRVADGSCGTWRRTVEENSSECFQVELLEPEGDRFNPVVFSTSQPANFIIDEGVIGNVTMTPDRIYITGDGRIGTGYISIEGKEFSYEIVEEPRCGGDSAFSVSDCLGYRYSGPGDGFIYYGEEDDQIVEWELAYLIYDSRGSEGIIELFEKGSEDWNAVQETVDKYNRVYEESGVYVRYVLKEGAVGLANWSNSPRDLSLIARDLDLVDVYIGKGNSCPSTCGCAYASTSFAYNLPGPVGGASVCDIYTDLHEIGHSVGLAHGPDNQSNAGVGYIFPEFGHGHSSTVLCGADLMSYAGGSTHLNSNITCQEMFGRDGDIPTGDRTIADAAYSINRVRYDVSLINCEDNKCIGDGEEVQFDEQVIEQVLVEDLIDDFENGHEMVYKERRRLHETYRVNLK